MTDKASGEGGSSERNPTHSFIDPFPDPLPSTVIGMEVGPERAAPGRGFAPIVPNDAWDAEDHSMPYWCVRRGGIIPRVHRPEHFLVFDLGLPSYRRCPRCGWTIVIGGRG